MTRFSAALFAVFLVPVALAAHESFLPLHDHTGGHTHGEEAHAGHSHAEPDGKGVHVHHDPVLTEERFSFAVGGRYTRYSVDGEKSHLWETGFGVDFAVTKWLHLGADASYGWYDSDEGSADGWLVPHAHLDLHLPLSGRWEVLVGMEVGFPGGDEALVGDHWEWAPHLELRYDPGQWFAEAGSRLVFITDESDHDHDEHADDEHEHEADFHEIVEPHGQRELHYFGVAGVRLLDRHLTLEGRVSGIHVLAGETPAENYGRAGLRGSWTVRERMLITAESNVPITGPERSEWQVSVGLRVGF